MILVIDNYDSFVHNLARHFRLLGFETKVVRHDAISIEQVKQLSPEAIVLSPGPGRPSDAGISIELVKECQDAFPILGVCLGHQIIAEAFGAQVTTAKEILHGRTSKLRHQGDGLFADLPTELTVCRYHSLVVDEASLSDTDLLATAWADDGTVMALAHKEKSIYGVQFHPEAILTDLGMPLLRNFVRQSLKR